MKKPLDLEIRFYENLGMSPAYPMVDKAMVEIRYAGYSHPRNQPPHWSDAALVAFRKDPSERLGPTKYEVVGFLAYRHIPDRGSWWIMLAHTMPKYRRCGVHSALFSALVERAKANGDILAIESATHPDNKAAQASFAKQGRVLQSVTYEYVIDVFAKGAPLGSTASGSGNPLD